MPAPARAAIKSLNLLSFKGLLHVVNLGDDDAEDPAAALTRFALTDGDALPVCSALEREVSELDTEDERTEFRAELGLGAGGLARVVEASFGLMGWFGFLTAGEQEVRAWEIRNGSTALEAAGKIHSDIQRGFIRAEVTPYGDLVECGSFAEARNRGVLRLEGKTYVVQDGDVITFRFNV